MQRGGAGEAHVLTPQEMGRIYQIGVEEGKGKVPVYAGLREPRSAAAMYEVAKAAIDAGVDAVQIYQLDNGHGMIPNAREQEAYWRELLDEVDAPVAISIHYDAKFKASTRLLQVHQGQPMKLAFFDDFKLGVVNANTIVDASHVVRDMPNLGPQSLMSGLIERFASYRPALEKAAAAGKGVSLGQVRIRPPLPRPRTSIAWQ